MKGNKKLIVVVPAYNEEKTIAKTITELKKQKNLVKGFELLVYVVNDGSKDNTLAEAKKAGADKIVNHKVNRGLGAAIRSGLTAARNDKADIAIKFDADLQHDPADIKEIIKPIVEDNADIVYGKRFDKIEYRMPVVRRLGNIFFTKLMCLMTGWPLKDSQPGIFAVNADYLSLFFLPGDYNYTQQVLLDAYYNGMRFEHVAVSFRKRNTGKSFVSMKYPFKVFYQILLLLICYKPMKFFSSLGFLSLITALIIIAYEMFRWLTGITGKPVVHVNAVMVLILIGSQFFFFGLLAELMVLLNRKR